MNDWEEHIERRYSESLWYYIIAMCSRFIISFVYLSIVVSCPFASTCRLLHRFACLPFAIFFFFSFFCKTEFMSCLYILDSRSLSMCYFQYFLFICVHYSFDSIWCYVLVLTYMRATPHMHRTNFELHINWKCFTLRLQNVQFSLSSHVFYPLTLLFLCSAIDIPKAL